MDIKAKKIVLRTDEFPKLIEEITSKIQEIHSLYSNLKAKYATNAMENYHKKNIVQQCMELRSEGNMVGIFDNGI